MRFVLLSSFVGPVCMGEGQPRLLLVGPLAVLPPPLGPFVTGASMLLMICEKQQVEKRKDEKRFMKEKGMMRMTKTTLYKTIFL